MRSSSFESMISASPTSATWGMFSRRRSLVIGENRCPAGAGGGRYVYRYCRRGSGGDETGKPRIAIPEHYWWAGAQIDSPRDFHKVKRLNGLVLKISKQELPPPRLKSLSSRSRPLKRKD